MEGLVRSRAEALLTVRLVLATALEREGQSLADTVLAYEPLRAEPTEQGWIFAYRDSAYGLIAGEDERRDYVFEATFRGSVRASRLLDRAGRVLARETVDRSVDRRALAGQLTALWPPSSPELN